MDTHDLAKHNLPAALELERDRLRFAVTSETLRAKAENEAAPPPPHNNRAPDE